MDTRQVAPVHADFIAQEMSEFMPLVDLKCQTCNGMILFDLDWMDPPNSSYRCSGQIFDSVWGQWTLCGKRWSKPDIMKRSEADLVFSFYVAMREVVERPLVMAEAESATGLYHYTRSMNDTEMWAEARKRLEQIRAKVRAS